MIQFNTDINFIASSGGVLQDIDHITFTPLGLGFLPLGDTDPNLPSGSLWLRQNKGQIERLNYQGANDIFEARNAEGYAAYVTTTSQEVSSAVIGTINFETIIVEDTQFVQRNGATNEFTFHVAGVWRCTFSARFDTPTGGSQGVVRGMWATENPSNLLDSMACDAFVASNGDQGGGCVYSNHDFIINEDTGMLFQCRVFFASLETNLVEAMITFELIRPDSQTPLST